MFNYFVDYLQNIDTFPLQRKKQSSKLIFQAIVCESSLCDVDMWFGAGVK